MHACMCVLCIYSNACVCVLCICSYVCVFVYISIGRDQEEDVVGPAPDLPRDRVTAAGHSALCPAALPLPPLVSGREMQYKATSTPIRGLV